MATRFDTTGESYSVAAALGTLTTFTLACWLKVSTVSSNARTTAALTVGTWYFAAIAVNGTAATIYYRDQTTQTTTSAGLTGLSASVNAATLRLGVSVQNSDWLDGCLSAVKVWNATLSQAELNAESTQYVPARTTNLQAWYPLIIPETRDYSGNSRTLTGGTGTAQEAGPDIPYTSVWERRPVQASASAISRASNY
jgi:hypothetical protein